MKQCQRCGKKFSLVEWLCPACQWLPPRNEGILSFTSASSRKGTGFHPEAFTQLAQVEEGSFWFRSRNQLILWALRTYFSSAQSFFEVGCGTGFVLSAVAAANPEIRLAGSEIFAEGLRFAAQRLPGVELMQMDARTIPFVDEFDAIGIFDVLEHIEEDERVLGQIFQALRPGGGLLITVPQHMFLWSAVDEAACHVRRYAAADLRAKVEEAGFQVLRSTSFVSLLLPALLLSRLKEHVCKKAKPACELALPKAWDILFGHIMAHELILIRQGGNFPYGGSRFLIAKKQQ